MFFSDELRGKVKELRGELWVTEELQGLGSRARRKLRGAEPRDFPLPHPPIPPRQSALLGSKVVYLGNKEMLTWDGGTVLRKQATWNPPRRCLGWIREMFS